MPTRQKPECITMAELMRLTGYSRPVLQDMVKSGTLHREKDNTFPRDDTLGAIIRKLREKDAGNEDRQRKNKAEADSAEADALERSKTMCSIEDAKLYWSDGRIAVRQAIERSDLTPTQKTKLLATIAKIHPKPPEPI